MCFVSVLNVQCSDVILPYDDLSADLVCVLHQSFHDEGTAQEAVGQSGGCGLTLDLLEGSYNPVEGEFPVTTALLYICHSLAITSTSVSAKVLVSVLPLEETLS